MVVMEVNTGVQYRLDKKWLEPVKDSVQLFCKYEQMHRSCHSVTLNHKLSPTQNHWR